MDDYQKPDKLENLEKKLYNTNVDIKLRPREDLKNSFDNNTQSGWSNEVKKDFTPKIENLPKKKISFFNKILIFSIIFFVLASSYSAYVFLYKSRPQADNVNINVNSSVSVASAQEFTFDIIIENNNPLEMQSVDLIIEYPEGTKSGKDINIDLPRERYRVDNISPGSILRETKNVYLFGEEGDTKDIKIKLIYKVSESNSDFEKEKSFNVLLKSSPIKLNISSVNELTSGQDLDFDVEIVSNSANTINNAILKIEYPFGFVFESSTIRPDIENNIWIIDKLDPTESISFKIKGKLQGQNNEDKFFKFNIGLQDPKSMEQVGVLFDSISKNVLLVRPFLELEMLVNNNKGSVVNVDSNQNQEIVINYKNNTKDVIRDVEVVLKIEGDFLVKETIESTGGFYRSIDNSIVWDKTTFPEFADLQVGESGFLDISLLTKDLTYLPKYTNPQVSFSAKVEGLRYEDPNVPEKIVNEIFKKIRLNTVVTLNAESLFYNGPFINTGVLPMTPDSKTSFTLNFEIKNTSNRISNGILEMSLPNYVEYVDKTYPANANFSYDSRSRKVTWKIGEIKEKSGYELESVKGAFQVLITPSISQIGDEPSLVNNIIFTGNDTFTGNKILIKNLGLNTAISDSKKYNEGKVVR